MQFESEETANAYTASVVGSFKTISLLSRALQHGTGHQESLSSEELKMETMT
jgi:hypothetical protein